MKNLFPPVRWAAGILCCLVIIHPTLAQTNVWTHSTSGNWQDASWSLGVLPGPAQDIFITNAGWKAVAIGPTTAKSFPQTLSVTSVTLASTSTNINTLLLNFAGTGNPLIIGTSNSPGSLSIDASSTLVMLSSALQVQNTTNGSPSGAFDINGTFTESVGSHVDAAFLNLGRTGTYNLTNSILFGGKENISGHFSQQEGTNSGQILLELDGQYDLYDGFLVGTMGIFEPGIFIQHGGSVSGSLSIGSGVYELDAGFISCSNISIGGSYPATYPYGGGDFVQNGGTNFAGNLSMSLGPGSYTLAGGVLNASNLTIVPFNGHLGFSANTFNQSAGYHTNGAVSLTGAIGFGNVIAPASYDLSGGTLETPSMTLSMGAVVQSGGTNKVGVVPSLMHPRTP